MITFIIPAIIIAAVFTLIGISIGTHLGYRQRSATDMHQVEQAVRKANERHLRDVQQILMCEQNIRERELSGLEVGPDGIWRRKKGGKGI